MNPDHLPHGVAHLETYVLTTPDLKIVKLAKQISDIRIMIRQWFLITDEFTEGPFSTEEIQSRNERGQIAASALIWGRGMSDWRDIRWWAQELPRLKKMNEVEAPAPELWHFAVQGKSHGPFKRDALLQELRRAENLSEALLWTKGMKEWAPLFEFHDILSALGLNKREYPRADLHGKAVVKGDGFTLIAPLLTISEGGLGIQLESGLVSGQIVSVEIQSPVFREVLNIRAEVRYLSEGVVGLRFQGLNAETKAAILAFVRQTQTRLMPKAA